MIGFHSCCTGYLANRSPVLWTLPSLQECALVQSHTLSLVAKSDRYTTYLLSGRLQVWTSPRREMSKPRFGGDKLRVTHILISSSFGGSAFFVNDLRQAILSTSPCRKAITEAQRQTFYPKRQNWLARHHHLIKKSVMLALAVQDDTLGHWSNESAKDWSA